MLAVKWGSILLVPRSPGPATLTWSQHLHQAWEKGWEVKVGQLKQRLLLPRDWRGVHGNDRMEKGENLFRCSRAFRNHSGNSDKITV